MLLKTKVMKKQINRISTVLLYLIVILIPAYSEEKKNSAVSCFDAPVTIRFSMQVPLLVVVVKPEATENETSEEESAREKAHTTYIPTPRVSGGFGLFYKGFGATYTQKIANLSDVASRKVTKYTDIRLNEYYRKFGADIIYMDYKGFYIDDTKTRRSDIRLKTASATGYYIFSDDFSLRAAFIQNEKQNKLDWTMLAAFSGVYQSLESDYSIIPQKDEAAYHGNAGLKDGTFRGFSFGAGLGLTVPYRDYLFSVIGCYGSGYMHRVYRTAGAVKTEHDGFYSINAKSSFCYNARMYFYGISFVFDSIANYSGIRILDNTYTFELYSGIRF